MTERNEPDAMELEATLEIMDFVAGRLAPDAAAALAARAEQDEALAMAIANERSLNDALRGAMPVEVPRADAFESIRGALMPVPAMRRFSAIAATAVLAGALVVFQLNPGREATDPYYGLSEQTEPAITWDNQVRVVFAQEATEDDIERLAEQFGFEVVIEGEPALVVTRTTMSTNDLERFRAAPLVLFAEPVRAAQPE